METGKNTYSKIVDTIESITRVDFSIYNNADVIKDSVISDPNGITIAEIYNNGEPIVGGVSDKRLGVTDNIDCGTCGETAIRCPGHFGHIRLVEPVFHMGFLLMLKNVLSSICIRCNKLLVYRNEDEISKLLKNKQGKQRFVEIRAITKKVTHCQRENSGCGTPVHKILIEKKLGSVYLRAEAMKKTEEEESEYTKKRSHQILTPQLCYDILRQVSDQDCMIMGFDPEKSRPEDMIIVNFPVPPVQVRPSIKMELLSSSTKDDDLTHKLLDIVKSNENLKDTKGDSSLIKTTGINDEFMFLQYHIATFYSNNIQSMPKSQQKNKKPTKSISERLKGKEGRIRGNLMGKRVDQSARTVITPDPYIAMNEVGIPLVIAKNLTYPEVVTKNNIKYLQQLVKNGRKIYPGANYVKKTITDNEGNETIHTYHLKFVERPVPLEIGDIVERQLVNGDIVLFNRQPSLHKLSMMGHLCHVINDPSILVFRINDNVVLPYNADHDGDEMNCHVPQTIQTVTELRLIANTIKRFVSPAKSNIVINPIQDALMGAFEQTYDTIRINWKDAMNILMTTSVGINSSIPKHKNLTGKMVMSEIIPKGINIVRKNDIGEFLLRVHNGVLTDGLLAKSQIQALVKNTWIQYGSIESKNLVDDMQRLVLQWLLRYGYTVSIKDTIFSDEVHRDIYKIVETKRKEALNTITEYENDPYVMTSEAFEINLRASLQAIQSDVKKVIMNNFKKDNGIYMCISAESSGTDMNAGQIIGCVGQVVVEGKRIQKKFNNRTLPTFHQHDNSAFARGFCANSFIKGLNPMEFFFQVMAGREGVIDTAITTADTGYIQRKLIKILEDIKVEYDGTVRNANDKIIQIVYGDNSINTEKQVEQKINLIMFDNKTVREKYIYSKEEMSTFKKQNKYTPKINDAFYRKLINLRDRIRKIQRVINTNSVAVRDVYMMPVDLQQIISNILNQEDRDNSNTVDPYHVLVKIKYMYSGPHSKIMKYRSDKSIIKKSDEHHIKLLLKTYLYDILAPKKCTHQYKLSQDEFDQIVAFFNERLILAKVEGGEMVGFVGAQSISEPVTQANLKSFHKAGTGMTVVGGLVRIKEILGVSRNMKTPVTIIVLDDNLKNDKIMVNKIASSLKYTTLRDVVDTVDIVYDPDPYNKNSIMTKDNVTNIFEGGYGKTGCQSEIAGLPWIIRLLLSKEKMIERNVTMLEIKTSFCNNWMTRFEDSKGSKKEYKKIIDKITQCAIITNFDNSLNPIVHVRFDANNYNFNTFIQFQDMIINKYRIKGIIGITESNTIVEESYKDFDEDGTIVTKKHFIIVTEGINLVETAQIKGINLRDTRCNDIVTVYETYGVEAARITFIKEFTRATESSSGGFSNYQHIELLADAVTHMGGLIAVNRHGTNKLDTDPFSRASFEKTVDQLLASAAFGEMDHIRSVSAKIMVGSLINGGTGCFDILLDHIKVKKTLFTTQPTVSTSLVKKHNVVADLIRKKKEKKKL